MKMYVTKCDNPKCKCATSKSLNLITINNNETIDLCDECLSKVIKFIKNGMDDTTIYDDVTTENVVDNKDKNEISISSINTDNVVKAENIVNNKNAVKTRNKSKIAEDFGIDIIKKMYVDEEMTAQEISNIVGVPKTTIVFVIRKYNIRKYNITKRNKKLPEATNNSDDNKEGH